jgi:hypothetical protein
MTPQRRETVGRVRSIHLDATPADAALTTGDLSRSSVPAFSSEFETARRGRLSPIAQVREPADRVIDSQIALVADREAVEVDQIGHAAVIGAARHLAAGGVQCAHGHSERDLVFTTKAAPTSTEFWELG